MKFIGDIIYKHLTKRKRDLWGNLREIFSSHDLKTIAKCFRHIHLVGISWKMDFIRGSSYDEP